MTPIVFMFIATIATNEIFHGSGVATAFVSPPIHPTGKSCLRHHGSVHAACVNDGSGSEEDIIITEEKKSIACQLSARYNQVTMKSGPRFQLSRRSFASIAALTVLNPIHPLAANADEPNNLYYKSKADEEDPLAVFGKSLQNMSGDLTNISSTPAVSGAGGADVDASSFSFNDIALPSQSSSSSDTSTAPPLGGDLGKAIQEKKESQKRMVDPRTHG